MARSPLIQFVVITPEQRVLEATTSALVFTAHDGELGVLRDRAPLMGELGIGQLRYLAEGQTRRLFIDGGFVQVVDNHVTILTRQAIPAEQITAQTVAQAEQALAALRGTDAQTGEARWQARRRVSVLRYLQPVRLEGVVS